MAIDVDLRNVTQTLRREFDSLTGRQVTQAASLAINKVLAKDRVFIGKEIRGTFAMNTFDAKSEIVQVPSTLATLTGSLKGNASFTPFEYFKISGENQLRGNGFKVKRVSKYKMVNGKRVVAGKSTDTGGEGRHATFEVTIKKGVTSLFTHAFVANTRNGPMLFNRGTYGKRTNLFNSISTRNPMERMRTLSVWQEMNDKRIVGKSAVLLRQEYDREFTRLMVLQLSGDWR